jgi:hypothetical protein
VKKVTRLLAWRRSTDFRQLTRENLPDKTLIKSSYVAKTSRN